VVRTLPNGIQTRWKHGPDGRLLSITHSPNPEADPILRFTYAYRPDDLVHEIEETTPRGKRTTRFEYDAERRLVVSSDSRLGETTYRYDAVGNRIELRRPGERPVLNEYDWAGRLTRSDGGDCVHDAVGNLAEYPAPGGPVRLTYTAAGLLRAVNAAQQQTVYSYDGDGNLVGRSSGAVETAYLPDPHAATWRPLAALHAGGAKTFYLWVGETLVGSVTNGEATYFLADHLGSVRCLTDRFGRVTDERDYCPFGVPRQPPGGRELEPGFCGLFRDPHSGLYLARHRAYCGELGRFTSPDPQHRVPFGAQDDLSPYSYCHDPVNHVDPDGAQPEKVWYQPAYQPAPPVLDLQRIIDRIANQPQAHFQSALGLGWASGPLDPNAMLRTAAGRFDVIYVTGSPHGVPGDVLGIPAPSAARGFGMRAPFSSDLVVLHSGASSFSIPSNRPPIYVGASRQGGLPFRDVTTTRTDPVPFISSLHPVLRPEQNGRYAGVEVLVRFGGIREFGRAVPELVREAGRGVVGVGLATPELGKAASNLLLGTRFPVFGAHDLGSYLNGLGDRVPPAGTFSGR
jgi:RHS repeat-associated protein